MHDANIREECMKAIMALPQARFVSRDVAERWIDMTLRADADRILWHVRRAGGFGGSDAGVLLDHASDTGFFSGDRASQFTTPDRLVRQKLFLVPPDVPGTDARRGIVLEPVIRSLFEDMLTREGYRWSRRDDLKSVIEEESHPNYPWLLSNVDGVYEIGGVADGRSRLVIVDFKAPTEESLKRHREELPFSYVAQMNHYALAAAGKEIRGVDLSLVMFDYRNFGENPLLVRTVESSQDIQNAIIHGGTSLWHDHVLAGCIPTKKVSADVQVPDNIREAALKLGGVNMEIKNLTDQKKGLSEVILDFMVKNDLPRLVVSRPDGSKVSFSVRKDLSDEAIERASAYSKDPSLFRLEFADEDSAAHWLMALLEALDQVKQHLPPDVLSLLGSPPDIVSGMPNRNAVREILRSIGEEPDAFSNPVLVVR